MNASPKGSPVLGPCYLPALPQATPKPRAWGPPEPMLARAPDPQVEHYNMDSYGKDIFPSPPKGAPIDH